MKKAIIKNEITLQESKAPFPSQNEAQEWIDKGIAGNWWGEPERNLWKDEASQILIERKLSEQEVEVSPLQPAWTEHRYAEYDEKGVGIGDPIETIEHPEVPAQYRTQITVPADYTVVIEDITAQVEAENIKRGRVELGRKIRACCNEVLEYITGYNVQRELPAEDVTAMITAFADAHAHLNNGRVDMSKAAIEAIAPDGNLATEELKTDCLEIFERYGF